MYDEKKVADSLRVCREARTFYQTGVFDNPKNVFDLDTFLPVADEVKENAEKEKYDEEFHEQLQKAIEYGNALRKQRGKQTVQEVVAQLHSEDSKVDTTRGNADISKIAAATELSEQILSKKENRQEKTEEKRRERAIRHEAKKWQAQQYEEEEEDISFGKILLHRLVELVICVVIAYGLSAIFNRFIGTHTIVDGSSMEATLHDEDVLAVNKICYTLYDPERFDIIVFPYDDESYYIKRIIGLPGETVEIADGVIYIDGSVLDESYGLEEMHEPDDDFEEVTLGDDEYFVLGDNRNSSKDSRSPEVGFVKRNTIIGKACFRLYPFDTMGTLE